MALGKGIKRAKKPRKGGVPAQERTGPKMKTVRRIVRAGDVGPGWKVAWNHSEKARTIEKVLDEEDGRVTLKSTTDARRTFHVDDLVLVEDRVEESPGT